MNDFSKPPLQSSVLDQFDLDPFELNQAEQCDQHPNPVKSAASQLRHSRPKVITISAIPVIDTPLNISAQDRDALDIPILTTRYSSHEAGSPVINAAQPQPYPGKNSPGSSKAS